MKNLFASKKEEKYARGQIKVQFLHKYIFNFQSTKKNPDLVGKLRKQTWKEANCKQPFPSHSAAFLLM
jgi:hypothetical protein